MKKRVGAGVARPDSGIGRFPLSREWGVRLIFYCPHPFLFSRALLHSPDAFPIPAFARLPPYSHSSHIPTPSIFPHSPPSSHSRESGNLPVHWGRASNARTAPLLLVVGVANNTKKILHFFGKKAEFDIQWTRCFAKPALLKENGRGDESHF